MLPIISEEQHQNSDVYLAAMSASMDGIALIGGDGILSYVNESYAKIYGFDHPKELIGRSWKDNHPELESARVIRDVIPILDLYGCWRGEILGLKRNGATFPEEISLTRLSSNTKGGSISVVRDISDQKKRDIRTAFITQSGVALSESLDFEETLAKAANFAVPDFATWCIITLVNEDNWIERVIVGAKGDDPTISALLSEVPFRVSEYYGHKRVHKTHSPDYIKKLNPELLMKLLPDEATRKRFEALAITSYICVPLRVFNNFIGAISFIRGKSRHHSGIQADFETDDVVAATQIADRMALAVQNARLYRETKEAVRSREDLIASVSHDLKNPLSAISINAEMIGRVVDGSPKESTIKKLATTIRLAVDRMTALIKELLELEKLRGGSYVIEKDSISLFDLVDAAIAGIEPIAIQKLISISKHLPKEDCHFPGDRERLLQVFSNLLGNAIKFTPSGGSITISAETLERELKCSVCDTGKGMTAEELPHVFDRYWQAEKSDKKGTGIGLSIARAIIEAHNGTIWAQSSSGKGSCFSFTLPVNFNKKVL